MEKVNFSTNRDLNGPENRAARHKITEGCWKSLQDFLNLKAAFIIFSEIEVCRGDTVFVKQCISDLGIQKQEHLNHHEKDIFLAKAK